MKIFNVEIYGLSESILASGYPKKATVEEHDTNNMVSLDTSKSYERCKKLGNAENGSGHDCFLKGIIVQFDITYCSHWALQCGRYHFIDTVSSQSKMHMMLKFDIDNMFDYQVTQVAIDNLKACISDYNNLTIEDFTDHNSFTYNKNLMFRRVIVNTPHGFELTMRMTTNYLQLKTIYNQRRKHKLEDWQIFCDWVESLPYFKEFCINKEER